MLWRETKSRIMVGMHVFLVFVYSVLLVVKEKRSERGGKATAPDGAVSREGGLLSVEGVGKDSAQGERHK